MPLVQAQRYFVLHAPRQTGKTSALKAWADYLNERGQYRAFYLNVEVGQASRDQWALAQLDLGAAFIQQVESDRLDLDTILQARQATARTPIAGLRQFKIQKNLEI